MSASNSASNGNVAFQHQNLKKRKQPKRRTLSCYPCRKHKLKCDRQIPCQSCIRYRREDNCKENPAPSALVRVKSRELPPTIVPGCWPAPDLGGDIMLEILSSPTQYSIMALVESCQSNTRLDPTYTMMFTHSRFALPVMLPQRTPMPSIPSEGRGNSSSLIPRSVDSKLFWKVQLASLLPPRGICDKLVLYYVENIDLIYHTIHIPSFQRQYDAFWRLNATEIDLIWLALLLTVISLSTLMAGKEYVEILGMGKPIAREWAHIWHQASRQALYAGDFELKPTLTQLQVFLSTQTYWLETKNHEILNS
jgi:Fungal Zn(2)-Cys(6) binuclear cluster domain